MCQEYLPFRIAKHVRFYLETLRHQLFFMLGLPILYQYPVVTYGKLYQYCIKRRSQSSRLLVVLRNGIERGFLWSRFKYLRHEPFCGVPRSSNERLRTKNQKRAKSEKINSTDSLRSTKFKILGNMA